MQPFSLLLGFGALTGLLLAVWRAPKKETIRYLDATLVVLFGSLVGSRAFSVVVNYPYYQAHPTEIYQVWLGGLSGIGALVGGILALIFIARWRKIPIGLLADTLLPLAGALTITAWLGCWLDSCSYGLPSSAWWALPTRDEWGILGTRVPVQLLGASITLLMIWLLEWLGKSFPVPGISGSLGLFGVSSALFGLSYLRADPIPVWYGLRLDAWGAMALMIFSGFIVVVLLVRWRINKILDSHKQVA
jgi:phosphatidylglycerol:prolipoprotein diacylglycerol transferase